MAAQSKPNKGASAVAGSSGKAKGKKATTSQPGLAQMVVAQVLTLDNAKTVVFWYIVYRLSLRAWRHLRIYGVTTTLYQGYVELSRRILTLLLKIPAAKRRVNKELDAATKDIEGKLIPRPTDLNVNERLPPYGKDKGWIRAELQKLHRLTPSSTTASKEGAANSVHTDQDAGSAGEIAHAEAAWRNGKVSGAVYHGGQELSDLIAEAIKLFLVSNPLHPDLFSGVRRMEAEIISMCLRMYNAPSSACGTTTSGGTESILMACKAYRDWARKEKGITEPELIIPESAHAAFDKAGAYFGIKVHHVPVDRHSRKVIVSYVARAINSNTIALVGSAPNFPDGAIDDIPSLASLAKRHKIGMHVDACLGSFLVPFLERAGLPSEPFDFRVQGVTSISCDTHKYGFACKGSSVVMYRDQALRRCQYYVQPDWSGGVYASPTIAGSRPGALIAGTWTAMMSLGEDGYTKSCHEIVGAARAIEQGIRDEIPDLQVLGKPLVSVVAFASSNPSRLSIYEVGDLMSKRGYHLNGLATDPPAVHIACTTLTVPIVEELLRDLKECVAEAGRSSKGPKGSMAQLYGLGSSSAVGPALVTELATRFIDTLTKM
ncbi:sphinganine-1-phosphate aldolase [Jaminaea rosea]|uniref:sphinganine-1-phosphate aldolase n=1 Tax=Jaminaea rosea TaxID=1569628 RepID=A0A316V405_9BASI|nr:sphinganine-1-phosphate aldolase [Jaminaea rosea]PWN30943.1 sphinganine-1-phosphate aldolase [Jaminaea rosea]